MRGEGADAYEQAEFHSRRAIDGQRAAARAAGHASPLSLPQARHAYHAA